MRTRLDNGAEAEVRRIGILRALGKEAGVLSSFPCIA